MATASILLVRAPRPERLPKSVAYPAAAGISILLWTAIIAGVVSILSALGG